MPDPTVSFIVATFKSEPDYLRAALDSALQQTLSNIEIVVGDDSPNDSVARIASAYRDERIVYHKNVPSLGVAGNHRSAINKARAPYVSVLNHDDFLEPRFAEVLSGALTENPEAVVAFCDHWVVDDHGTRLEEATDKNTRHWKRDTLAPGMHKPFYNLLVSGSIPSAMGAIFRKDALAFELPLEAGPAYDLWLTLLLSWNGGGAFYEPERLSSWRTHAGSITSQGSEAWSNGEAACWSRVLQEDSFRSIHEAARHKAALSYFSGAVTAWRNGSTGAAREGVRKALTLHPSPKAYALLLLCSLPAWMSRPLAPLF